MSEFVEHLHDVFAHFGPVTARRMFGGYGIYHDGLMFALVADETLYLKADAIAASYFEREGLGNFTYATDRKVVKMSYYRAPGRIMDDRDEAAIWGRRSFEAALRAQRPKKKTKR
ncbi:MAG: TfoX/Sxy family protein [Beijerinckiaceae bacterium]|nr:TfoX/Sxy family protein [Beijerinckiaceae bacterium]MCI0736007.1 TfoX/Sxy family protein [Beijerinckiaceae bacterium]